MARPRPARRTPAAPTPAARALVRRPEAIAAALALLVRLAYLATASGPAFDDPLVDADYYDFLGQLLAAGLPWPEGPFWQPPLYPALLGAVYAVAGPGLLAPRLLQAALGAGTAALSARLATRAGAGPGGATIAGVLVALHGPLVFYAGELLPVTLGSFLGTAALALALEGRGRLAAAAAGLVAGLGAITLAPLVLLLPAVAVASARLGRGMAAACLGAALLPVATTAALNHGRSGEWLPISANGGINLWLGNNADADRTVAIRPGAGWEELVLRPRREGHRSAATQDAWFVRQAVAFCAAEPVACAGNLLHKARLLLASRELPRNEDLAVVRGQSPVLAALTASAGGAHLPWVLLAPLAAAGVAPLLRRRDRAAAAVLLATVGLASGPVLFFVTGRHRAPLVPLAAVLAAAGAVELATRLRALRRAGDARVPVPAARPAAVAAVAAVAASLVPALAAFVLAAWPVHLPIDELDFEAELHYAVGGRRARLGDDAGAARAWERALARRPDYLEARFNLALARERLDEPQAALRLYRELLAAHPDHEGAAERVRALSGPVPGVVEDR